MRLSKPQALRLLNSTGELTPGSGVDLPRIIATIATSFRIAFKERSNKWKKGLSGTANSVHSCTLSIVVILVLVKSV